MRIWIVALAVACAGAATGPGGEGPRADDPRHELLQLCDAACQVQSEGDGCGDDGYLEWCLQTCRTYDGMLLDECLDEAGAAMICWTGESWYCDGSYSYYDVEQPAPYDEEACIAETDAFYDCG